MSIIFILILAMFSFFRSARHRSRAGVMEIGIVTEEWASPRRQSSLYYVFAFFVICFQTVNYSCLSFEILVEVNDFSLLHT